MDSFEYSTEADKGNPILFALGAVILIFVLYTLGSTAVFLLVSGPQTGPLRHLMPLAFGASQLLLMFVPALLFARMRGGSVQRRLRFGKASVAIYAAVILGVLALNPLIETYMLAQELYLVPHSLSAAYAKWQHNADDAYDQLLNVGGGSAIVISFLVGCIIPGLSEETLFRGLVQGSFAERLRPIWAILFAAFIFGLLHLQVTLLPLVAVGAFLGYTAWAAESILPSIVGHATFNALAVVVINLPGIAADRNAAHTTGDLIASLPAAGVGALLLTGAILWIRAVRRTTLERRSQLSFSQSTDL